MINKEAIRAKAQILNDELCRQARGRLGYDADKFNAAIEVALTQVRNETVDAVMEIWGDWGGNGLTCQEFIDKYKLDVEMKTPTLPWLKEAIRRLRIEEEDEP